MNRPSFIGHYLEFLDEDNATYPGSTELLSIGSAVGKKLGLKKIGVHIEHLPPGRRTSWPHAEGEEEEFAFVLEGYPHVWIDGYLHALKPGDFVAFPSGTGITHTFLNNSQHMVRMLVGGQATHPDNKIIYPLHDERNLLMKTKECFWENAPRHELGPHNGLPDDPKNLKWNIPVLETDRLILRPLELSDAPAVFQYGSNPRVVENVTWYQHQTLADSEAFIKFAHTLYLENWLNPMGIAFKEKPEWIIGTVGAFWNTKSSKTIELGAALDEQYWGQGITVEALKKIVEVSWTHYDVARIQGRCKAGNTKSRRMMEKLGMSFEGTLKKSLFVKGESWDMEMFSLTK